MTKEAIALLVLGLLAALAVALVLSTADCPPGKVAVRGLVAFECAQR